MTSPATTDSPDLDLRRPPAHSARGWSWVLAPIVFLLAQLFTALGWSRPYSWATNNISDLGVTSCGPWPSGQRYVCSPWHAVMNVGFVLTGLLIVSGAVLGRRSRNSIAGPGCVLVLLTGLAYVVAGFAPADRHENVHVVLAALPIFLLGNAGLVLAALRRSTWSRGLRVTVLLLGVVGLAAMVLFFGGRYAGLGMGGMEGWSSGRCWSSPSSPASRTCALVTERCPPAETFVLTPGAGECGLATVRSWI
jgi:hypothetical membrane protein